MGNKLKKQQHTASAQLSEEDIEILLANTSFDREQIFDWHKNFIVNIYLIYCIYFIGLN